MCVLCCVCAGRHTLFLPSSCWFISSLKVQDQYSGVRRPSPRFCLRLQPQPGIWAGDLLRHRNLRCQNGRPSEPSHCHQRLVGESVSLPWVKYQQCTRKSSMKRRRSARILRLLCPGKEVEIESSSIWSRVIWPFYLWLMLSKLLLTSACPVLMQPVSPHGYLFVRKDQGRIE